jgi:hypothetical protein
MFISDLSINGLIDVDLYSHATYLVSLVCSADRVACISPILLSCVSESAAHVSSVYIFRSLPISSDPPFLACASVPYNCAISPCLRLISGSSPRHLHVFTSLHAFTFLVPFGTISHLDVLYIAECITCKHHGPMASFQRHLKVQVPCYACKNVGSFKYKEHSFASYQQNMQKIDLSDPQNFNFRPRL